MSDPEFCLFLQDRMKTPGFCTNICASTQTWGNSSVPRFLLLFTAWPQDVTVDFIFIYCLFFFFLFFLFTLSEGKVPLCSAPDFCFRIFVSWFCFVFWGPQMSVRAAFNRLSFVKTCSFSSAPGSACCFSFNANNVAFTPAVVLSTQTLLFVT